MPNNQHDLFIMGKNQTWFVVCQTHTNRVIITRKWSGQVSWSFLSGRWQIKWLCPEFWIPTYAYTQSHTPTHTQQQSAAPFDVVARAQKHTRPQPPPTYAKTSRRMHKPIQPSVIVDFLLPLEQIALTFSGRLSVQACSTLSPTVNVCLRSAVAGIQLCTANAHPPLASRGS